MSRIPPARIPLGALVVVAPRRGAVSLSHHELAAAAGISPARLARLVRLGLVDPIAPGSDEFPAAAVARLRRMLRLHDDLGVDLLGTAIIADLLERIDRLEAELSRRGGGA